MARVPRLQKTNCSIVCEGEQERKSTVFSRGSEAIESMEEIKRSNLSRFSVEASIEVESQVGLKVVIDGNNKGNKHVNTLYYRYIFISITVTHLALPGTTRHYAAFQGI